MRINFTEKDHQNVVNLYKEDDRLTDFERSEILFANLFQGEIPRYLYVINQIGTNFYKIGITNDLNKRIRALQTGNPNTLNYVIAVQSDLEDSKGKEIIYLERFLHRNYKSRRKNGEWFQLSRLDVCKIFLFLSGTIYSRDLAPTIPPTALLSDVIELIDLEL